MIRNASGRGRRFKVTDVDDATTADNGGIEVVLYVLTPSGKRERITLVVPRWELSRIMRAGAESARSYAAVAETHRKALQDDVARTIAPKAS